MAPTTIETTFHVRYAETDQMGIVHHASYVVWLEEGRSSWLRFHGRSYADFEREGLMLAVSDLQVRFEQAARYDQRVTVRCWVGQLSISICDTFCRLILASYGELAEA